MITIRGNYTNALCFTDALDDRARRDIRNLCDRELLKDRKMRFMPDVHPNGDGTLTGFTMILKEPVILALEYGSGCGVCCAQLAECHVNFKELDAVCHEIPASGMGPLFEPAFEFDFSRLRCYPMISSHYEWPSYIGCLGGGNHFIELERDEEGRFYLVVHNGLTVSTRPVLHYYRKKALLQSGKYKDVSFADWKKLPMEDTCLYGQDMEDYLHDMQICEELSRANRLYITEYIAKRMGFVLSDYLDRCHQYSDLADGIVRHGAVAAHAGQRVIIPVNAKEGCILGTGLGNQDWNCSAPHGGGRRMSRREARETLRFEDYQSSMQNVYSTSVLKENLDEAPYAYKTMDSIIRQVKETVKIEKILRPVYNYKGI